LEDEDEELEELQVLVLLEAIVVGLGRILEDIMTRRNLSSKKESI